MAFSLAVLAQQEQARIQLAQWIALAQHLAPADFARALS